MNVDFLKWIEHAGFMFESKGKRVYVDPFRIGDIKEHADMILITHPHSDHLSPEDIVKIADSNTVVFVPKDSVSKIPVGKVVGVEPNKRYGQFGIVFSTVPAYNNVENKLHFHPKERGWVGYIIDINGNLVYHAGDTDFIDEMHGLKTGLALLPIGGTYVMTVDDAIEASKVIDAEAVAPIHYRRLLGKEGSKMAEEKWKKLAKNGIILNQIREPEYSSIPPRTETHTL